MSGALITIEAVDPLAEAEGRGLVSADPACPRWLLAILLAERMHLCALDEGESLLRRIYDSHLGPSARRRALQKYMMPRVRRRMEDRKAGGAFELTIMAAPRWVVMELAWCARADELYRSAACAQTEIGIDLQPDWE